MPSPADRAPRRGWPLRLLAAALLAGAQAAGAAPPPAASGAASANALASPRFPLDAAAVAAATTALRRETGLGETHKERTWRFKRGRPDPEKRASPDPWLLSLGRWLAEGGRVLIWILGAAALAFVLVMARRWLQVRGETVGAGARLPSHVRELDIRPESLPSDIGAAVRALWLAGERRAALSLLYRGALSRLVHSHGVAIGDASTEGDCVALARAALPAEQSTFFQLLVQAWLLAIYGGRPVESSRVMQLCDDFERMLPATAAQRTAGAA